MPMLFLQKKKSSFPDLPAYHLPKKSGHSIQSFFQPEEKSEDVSVEDNIGLALKCASKFVDKDVKDSEEYSIALIGLWHAAETFDPLINATFSTYAWKCMRSRILDSYKFNSRKKRDVPLVRISELEGFDVPEEEVENLMDDFPDLGEILNFDDSEEKNQRDKQMLKMRFLENKSWQEIGDCYDMTKAGARHCVFSLIDKIRSSV